MNLKTKKRLACLLALAVLFMTLSACTPPEEDQNADPATGDVAAPTTAGQPETGTVYKLEVANQVLLNNATAKIEVTGTETDERYVTVLTKLKCKTDETISVSYDAAAINGITLFAHYAAQVEPGEEATVKLQFDVSSMVKVGIKEIKEIDLKFYFNFPNSYREKEFSDSIKIRTSVPDSYVQTYNDSGEVIYDKDGIKIVSQGVDPVDIGSKVYFHFYIENNTGRDLQVSTQDTAVNDYMVNSSYTERLHAGKKAYGDLYFEQKDLQANGIERIESIELGFKFYYYLGNKSTQDTELYTVTF
jgi:hypothetical protein